MSVSVQDRITAAYAAGFRNGPHNIEALTIIVAISMCECGIGNATCEHGCNPDAGGTSCGIWQVFQGAHPGTAQCASDPTCCARLAWEISNGGTDFNAWCTYRCATACGGAHGANCDCFLGHLGEVRAAIAAMPPPIGPTPTPGPTPSPVPVPPPTPVPTQPGPGGAGSNTAAALLLLGAGAALTGGYLWEREHPGWFQDELDRLHHHSPAASGQGVRSGLIRPSRPPRS